MNSQPISQHYDHLVWLDLADSADIDDSLEVDVLIESDFYWSLVTGRVRWGRSRPTAIQTKVLSGPVDQQETSVSLTLTATHTLKIDTYPVEHNLDDQLRRFWELESLGILKGEPSVYEKFIQKISFNGQRYMGYLGGRIIHAPLPDNFEFCRKRLIGLLKRLKKNPRGNGPSLNDYLYTGPSFGQSILLRFRLHRVALAGDIEKVAVERTDRDSLRFLWARGVEGETPEMIVLRFTRVVFGVSSTQRNDKPPH